MFNEMFRDLPVGRTAAAHWADQDTEALDGAARAIETHGADPWVFAGDARHFWQFASIAEAAALQSMTAAQAAAILVNWDDGDHDPATFGYSWPQ